MAKEDVEDAEIKGVLLIDNASRRLVSSSIGKMKGRRSEFRTGSATAEVVDFGDRLDCSSEVSESMSMLVERKSEGVAISY